MPSFNRGDVIPLSLDADDFLLFSGTASYTVSPSGGTVQYSYVSGQNQPIGPFGAAVSVVITCDTAGSYVIQNNPTLAFSLAQSSRTDINGFVASTASGNVVFPDGVSSSIPFVLYDSATEVICPNNTSNNVLVAVTIPAEIMRKNSVIRWRVRTSEDNNANTKTLAVRFGGGVINCYSAGISAVVSRQIVGEIENLNSRYHQRCTPINVSQTMGSLTQAWVYGNVDTTNDQLLTIELKKATAADYFAIQSVYVEVLNANV